MSSATGTLARMRVLASDSLVYGLAGVVSRFLSVWLVPIYTRLFSPEDYGVMGLVTSTITMVAIFVVLALDNSAARWYWDTEDETDRKTTITSGAMGQLATATVFAALIYVSSDYLGTHLIGRADAGLLMRLVALTLPLNQFSIVVIGWLRAQRRPVATMVFVLATNLVQIGLTLLFVVAWRWGLRGVYVAQVVAQLFASVVALALLRDWLNPRYFSVARLREMLRFALPMIPAAVAVWVVGFADRYFVKLYASTAEVGLYSVGNSLAQGIVLLTGAFQQAWGPFALSIHKEPDANRTYANSFLAYVVITAIAASGLSLFAPEVIHILATDRYLGAASVVGMLALGYVMVGLGYIAATGPAIVKTTGPTGVAVTIAAVLNIVLNVLLVPKFGKVGSAAATLVSQTVTPVYLFVRAQRLYHIPYRFRTGIAIYGLSLALVIFGTVVQLGGLVGVAVKLALMASFLPVLAWANVLTRERTRAWYSAVRSYAQ
jgi:O-antigen/teichoic acid export membrane protein